ncbi:MAG: formylglycine-generating enzyme family protein [Tepidisphaeraceae bacterium]|jgi:formylglycine-generating enzyme required for sulfatase activity
MRYETWTVGVRVALFSSLVLGLLGCGKAEKNLKPQLTIDLGNGLTMEFVLVQPGSFMMGTTNSSDNISLAAQPQHRVEISKPFYLGKYEVTQEQWQSVMGNNPSRYRDIVGHPLTPPQNEAKCPVECVSWNDCQTFLGKVKAKAPGTEFCLPTEAQWEYACRAGSSGEYCYGDGDASLGDYAWCEGNSDGRPHPVGQKKPNAWGLYDMHGNVWEWCADRVDIEDDYYANSPSRDPQGPTSGAGRVYRGGSYMFEPPWARSYSRFSGPSFDANNINIGLRVCISIE